MQQKFKVGAKKSLAIRCNIVKIIDFNTDNIHPLPRFAKSASVFDFIKSSIQEISHTVGGEGIQEDLAHALQKLKPISESKRIDLSMKKINYKNSMNECLHALLGVEIADRVRHSAPFLLHNPLHRLTHSLSPP